MAAVLRNKVIQWEMDKFCIFGKTETGVNFVYLKTNIHLWFFGSSGVVFPTAGKLGGFGMPRNQIQQSRKPALASSQCELHTFLHLQDSPLGILFTRLLVQTKYFIVCTRLAFLQCAWSNKAGSGGATLECVFPSQAQQPRPWLSCHQ